MTSRTGDARAASGRGSDSAGRGGRLPRRGFVGGALALGGAFVLAPPVARAAPAAQIRPADVITANRFTIAVDGYAIATFQELQGIESQTAPSQYWETSGDSIQVNKLPSQMTAPEVTLRRGMNGSQELWAWHEAVRTGQMGAARRSATLTVFSAEGKPIARYWMEKAWPMRIDLAGLKAGASEALIETVVFACEYIQRIAL